MAQELYVAAAASIKLILGQRVLSGKLSGVQSMGEVLSPLLFARQFPG